MTRPHGHATVDPRAPRAFAVCDRCGGLYNHHQLQWQFQWQGPKLQNRNILVCPSCMDVPQEQLRTIIIPPDPMPIQNPRPEVYAVETNPLSGLGIHIGDMVGFGGLNAAFDGDMDKQLNDCCGSLISNSSFNTVGEQWIVGPQPVDAEAERQALAMSRFILTAPSNTGFLQTGSTPYEVQGSNDYCNWVTLHSSTTLGSVGEVIDVSVSAGTAYHFHRVAITGNGYPVGVAQFTIYGTFTAGSSTVPTTDFFLTEDGTNLVTENDRTLIAECP